MAALLPAIWEGIYWIALPGIVVGILNLAAVLRHRPTAVRFAVYALNAMVLLGGIWYAAIIVLHEVWSALLNDERLIVGGSVTLLLVVPVATIVSVAQVGSTRT
ncbi:MAG: hypothetical protein AAF458_24160 [Pseudomonadota bacterium]